MKLDKDTILKQRFWFLLLVAVPLILGTFFILMTTVRAAINNARKKLDGDLKAASSAGEIRNQEWVEAMEKKAKEMAAIEEKVWREAYEEQKELSTWPELIEKTFDFKDGKFATEIKVERGKSVSGKLPADDDTHFHGVVLDYDDDKVLVKGEKEETFHNTAKIKVSGDKISFFRDLRKGDRVAVTYIRSKYFFDPLTNREQEKFVEDDGYKFQIPEILEQVQPLTVDSDGEVLGGVVQFKSWTYKKNSYPPAGAPFFHYVAKPWKIQDHDISDEAWMAQEDLWLQREIYRIIREANDSVSTFKGEGGDGKGDSPKTYVFTNPYWELTLTLASKKKLGVQIKNLLPRRQRLDLDFLVRLQKNAKFDQLEKITIGGEPLGPLETREVKEHDVEGQAATGIYGVEQVINWETAAVKRIDQISFGSLASGDCAHGQRTYPQGLKPFKERKDKAGGGKQPGGPKLDPNMKMPDVGGFKGREGGDGNVTVNGLHADRYLEPPTRQTRRIPVGVALIVDQEHVDRVLLAFTKSRLRFVTTQVILNRYPDSVRPSGGTVRPKDKGKFNPKDIGEGIIAPGLGGFGGVRQQPAASAGSNQESNIELVIYGIMTMYERYPPRPQTSAK